jgi:hypothetical protein
VENALNLNINREKTEKQTCLKCNTIESNVKYNEFRIPLGAVGGNR